MMETGPKPTQATLEGEPGSSRRAAVDTTTELLQLHEAYGWTLDAALGEGRDDLAWHIVQNLGDEVLVTLATPTADFGRC